MNEDKMKAKADQYKNQAIRALIAGEEILKQRDYLLSLISKVINYRKGNPPYHYENLSKYDRENAAFDDWQKIEGELEMALYGNHTENEPAYRNALIDILAYLDKFGHGSSMMHPRLSMAIFKAKKHLEDNNTDLIKTHKCIDSPECGIGGYCPECPNQPK
jgi:hypothetical protein